ncbi:MAG TPA: hypothetical protein VF116_13785 [Ktedonobacterales bacterium]
MAQVTVTATQPAAEPTQTDTAKATTSAPGFSPTVRWLGFWSAVAMAATYVVFLVGAGAQMVGALTAPWDVIVTIGASILIAPAFPLLLVSVHHATPEAKRVWSHAAIAFGVLYAAFVSITYITWLFVAEPHVIAHTTSAAAATFGYQTSSMASGSFAYLLDGLGYTYMSLAVCLTAPIFTGGRLATWIRGIAIANGPIALLVLLAYVFSSLVLGLGALLVPVYGVLVALYFYKANPTPIQHPQSSAR